MNIVRTVSRKSSNRLKFTGWKLSAAYVNEGNFNVKLCTKLGVSRGPVKNLEGYGPPRPPVRTATAQKILAILRLNQNSVTKINAITSGNVTERVISKVTCKVSGCSWLSTGKVTSPPRLSTVISGGCPDFGSNLTLPPSIFLVTNFVLKRRCVCP